MLNLTWNCFHLNSF